MATQATQTRVARARALAAWLSRAAASTPLPVWIYTIDPAIGHDENVPSEFQSPFAAAPVPSDFRSARLPSPSFWGFYRDDPLSDWGLDVEYDSVY